MPLVLCADLVLPDRVVPGGAVIVDDGRIVDLRETPVDGPHGATRVEVDGFVVPGFIDVHVHGIEGVDVLDSPDAVAAVAARLPRYGVTAFCPTSVACDPPTLERLLHAVHAAQRAQPAGSARVVSAHLESNFINPDFRGAQPVECLRSPRPGGRLAEGDFDGAAILDAIARHRRAVGIVTLAPELDGGLELVAALSDAGHRVSIGHTAATYEQALAAIDQGVRHATHLFNRMAPMTHRAPGTVGAVLASPHVQAELICDGFHVHPAALAIALRAKGRHGVMAVTDATAGAGLPVGTRTRLGGQPIVVTPDTARLDDGTIAGSVLTMDRAFRTLVTRAGASLVDAVHLCATTPADALQLADHGRLAVGAIADLVVLGRDLTVRATYLDGQLWRNPSTLPVV